MQLFTLTLLVVVYIVHATSGAAAKTDPIIKYPGPTQYGSLELDDDIPEACRNLTYCTIKPKNYPEERFNIMLKNYKGIAQPSLVKITFENRQSDPTGGDDCDSTVTFEPLYKVREKRDDVWRTVVQAPERDYIQSVRLETCKKPDAPCFKAFSENTAYVTYCKQKYNIWEVLVAKGEHETEMVKAQLPVCCSCNYKPADM